MAANTVTRVSGRNGWFRADSVARMVADRMPFRTHGSLSGRWIENGDAVPVGQLADPDARSLLFDVRKGPRVFVVYSYSTPIAWITDDGTATVPDARYSVTTTRHQHAARMGIGVLTGEIARPSDWGVCAGTGGTGDDRCGRKIGHTGPCDWCD